MAIAGRCFARPIPEIPFPLPFHLAAIALGNGIKPLAVGFECNRHNRVRNRDPTPLAPFRSHDTIATTSQWFSAKLEFNSTPDRP
jgi:hypothetical protein